MNKNEFQSYDPAKEEQISLWMNTRMSGEVFKAGLDRLVPFFSKFKKIFNERGIKVITIAGTNGKGETCHRLGSHLKQNGHTYALWSSPHILSLRERFIVNGELISYPKLQSLIEKNKSLIEQLSFYEFHFYLFCELACQQEQIDFLILEVGLGGRLDAVNLFDADCSAIVSISKDHTEYLGESLREILFEKLGVTRSGSPLVSSLEDPQLGIQVQEHCLRKMIPHKDLFKNQTITSDLTYPQRNELLAKELFTTVTGKESQSIGASKLKGRYEIMTLSNLRFIFIGAHNLDGFTKMMQLVSESQDETSQLQILVAFSTREISEIHACLETLTSRKNSKIILTHFEHFKSLTNTDWLKLKNDVSNDEKLKAVVEVTEDWKDIIRSPNGRATKDRTFLVTGSYYFVGEVQKIIHSLS